MGVRSKWDIRIDDNAPRICANCVSMQVTPSMDSRQRPYYYCGIMEAEFSDFHALCMSCSYYEQRETPYFKNTDAVQSFLNKINTIEY